MSEIPTDIRPGWLNVIRRLQSVAHCNQATYTIITFTVLVDPEGCPRLWLEPECRKVEPKRTSEDLLKLFID